MDGSEFILKTLLYSKIFNYPLTKEEIFKFLISDRPIDKKLISKILKKGNVYVSKNNAYYFIKDKDNFVSERVSKEGSSEKKINIAKKIIKTLSIIPTIKFIGISGSLSMKNSYEDDDIDIFVITKSKQIWTTRFFLIFLLSLMGVYRKRNDKKFKDKICLNMIVDEDNMRFDQKNQDLFIAHEIAQMIPVLDKDNTYKKFLSVNSWTKNYLFNFNQNKVYIKQKSNIFNLLIVYILKLIYVEFIFEFLQKTYMKKHVTNETMRKGYLAFHPFDYRIFVLKSYSYLLKKYRLKLVK